MIDTLSQWVARGWLRPLDLAFARLVADLSPDAPPDVLVAAALVAHVEGQGQSCLDLDALEMSAGAVLGWDDDAVAALVRPRRDALCTSPVVQDGEDDTRDGRPLVLDGPRLYLRRYWKYERAVAAGMLDRGRASVAVDEAAARVWLDRLFPGAAGFDWQKAACALALRGRLSIITGGPGTGKTWTAARFLALVFALAPDPSSLRIALAAPTGKAAARLKQAIDAALDDLQASVGARLPLAALAARIGAARTLHGLLGATTWTRRFRHDRSNPLEVDLLIVDEASMVHVEMMAALFEALPPLTRVILLGDKDQLASVEAGAVLGDLCRDAAAGRYRADTRAYLLATTGQRLPKTFEDARGSPLAQQTVMLRISQRFGREISALATAINAGDAAGAGAALTGSATVSWTIAPGPAAVVDLAEAGYRPVLDAIAVQVADEAFETRVRRVLTAFDRFRVMCAVKDGAWGVAGLNAAIEERLARGGLAVRSGDWYEGRPVIVTRNDYDIGVFNGDVGIVLTGPAGGARAWFVDGEGVRSVAVARLADVETAFAMTVHRAQGSEFEHAVLVLPPGHQRVVTRELVYTGVTRARSRFTLVSSGRDVLADAIARPTRRSSGLHHRLFLAEGPKSPVQGTLL